jgi:AAT family amino acid transporter/GABA permease
MMEANSSEVAAPATELSRTLRGRHLMMISIGGIVGGGLFVGSSTSIRAAGPAAFLSYALTGLIILLIMRMLSEMAASSPHSRSFTEYARAGLGNGAGFVTGWLYWYVWVMTVPIEAIAGATILQRWIPLSQFQLGLGLMGVMTIVNLQSARSYAEFEFWFASIKVAAIIAFIALAASYAFGWTAPLVGGMHHSTFANLTDHGGFAPHGWIAVMAAVPTAFFSMTGAEITTIAAVESAHSSTAVARMSSLVIWRIVFFYVVSLFFIVSVSAWSDVRSGESPFTLALTTMRIPWADTIMSFIILTAVLSCLNSAFYVSSRILFVLAAHADAPASMIRLNIRRVPVGSVLAGSAAGFLGIVLATKAPQQIFDFLVSSTGAVVIFVYIITASAQIKLRNDRRREGRAAPAVTMWLFPWLSYATIAAMGMVLIAMAITPTLALDFKLSCVTLALAIAAYGILAVRRVRGRRSS